MVLCKEENPDKFHATGPFDLETGKSKKELEESRRKIQERDAQIEKLMKELQEYKNS